MFMVFAQSVSDIQRMQHIENIVAFICGAAIIITCAILLAVFAEKRVSAYEQRQYLIEKRRLQERENEVIRERDGFEQIDLSLKKKCEQQEERIKELEKQNANYKQQLDQIELGTFNGRSLKHV